MKRRCFLTVSAGTGTALLAGCVGDGVLGRADDDSSPAEDSDASDGEADEVSVGTFRLLISDKPVAIDDFDSLAVTFDSARVFRGTGEDEEQDDDVIEEIDGNESDGDDNAIDENVTADDEGDDETAVTEDDENESENESDVPEDDETTGDEDDGEEDEAPDEDDDESEDVDGDDRGFVVYDLAGATVDLTQVVGDVAIPVLEDELEVGTYSKIELRAAEVEGIVDDDVVDVKIPSGRLKIVRPFEVTGEEPVTFVFDINVVKRGNQDRYNLLPVIAKSGLQGEEIDVEEIEPDEGTDAEVSDDSDDEEAENDADTESEDDDEETANGGSGPPSDRGNGDGKSSKYPEAV